MAAAQHVGTVAGQRLPAPGPQRHGNGFGCHGAFQSCFFEATQNRLIRKYICMKAHSTIIAFFDSLCTAASVKDGTNSITRDFFKTTLDPTTPQVCVYTTISLMKKMIVLFDGILQIRPSLSANGIKRIYYNFSVMVNGCPLRRAHQKMLNDDLDPAAMFNFLDLDSNRMERLDRWLMAAKLSSFKTSNEVTFMSYEYMTLSNT